MKRVLALILSLAFILSGCGVSNITDNSSNESTSLDSPSDTSLPNNAPERIIQDSVPTVMGMNDPELLLYLEDCVYSELDAQLDSAKYRVESVSAVFVSQEYIDEVMFNSQSNVYFGYTLSELDELFEGTRYVFTLGDDGTTTVKRFEEIKDVSQETIIKNVAIGTGVILFCAVVSLVSGGAGAPAVAAVFAASAKTGTIMALSGTALGSITAGTIRGIETGDMDEALKAAALAGSDSFKWGAISGALIGGTSKGIEIYRANKVIPSPRQSELEVLARNKGATEQVAYLNGEEVSATMPGSTRPDVVIKNPTTNAVRAIEVKNYNLEHNEARLLDELERQITSRVNNLPQGSTQEIVLDVRGRGYEEEILKQIVKDIQERLVNVYPDIPVTLLRW